MKLLGNKLSPFAVKPEENPILAAAFELLKAGISVIPIIRITKKPAVNWEEFQHRRATEQEVRQWFGGENPAYDLAAVGGAISGNLVIVDWDYPPMYEKAWEFKGQTLEVSTGKKYRVKEKKEGDLGRGVHCWFKSLLPTRSKQIKLGDRVIADIKGEGGYVLVPPSDHGSGVKYEWKNDKQIMTFEGNIEQEVLETIHRALREKKSDKDFQELVKNAKDLTKYRERIDIEEILKAGMDENSGRELSAHHLACWYRKGRLEEPEALKKVEEWNKRNKAPLPYSEIIHAVETAYSKLDPYNYWFSRDPTEQDLERIEQLTPEIEAFLKHPKLHDNTVKIYDHNIAGETELKAVLHYEGVGAPITASPSGVITVDMLGTGKSYVQQQVATVFPKERMEQPTSMSMKVVNYLAENFRGRIVRIDELFGMEEGMPYIRVWMTNGRLEHWVTDPDSGKARKIISEGCPVFWTSTVLPVEEQYGSRNLLSHTKTDPKQTKQVHVFQDMHDAFPKEWFKEGETEVQFLTRVIRWVMQNTKPVLIPFRFSFPFHVPRARREKPKIKYLIKAIANYHQLQRKTVEYEGTTYIIAQIEDFEIAMKVLAPFLIESMYTLDKYTLDILKCAHLRVKEDPEDHFSVPEMQEDMKKRKIRKNISYSTIQRRLKHLEDIGYVFEATAGFPGVAAKYKLTELGKTELQAQIKIVDKGEWLLEAYEHLDDPAVKEACFKRFKEILEEELKEAEGMEE